MNVVIDTNVVISGLFFGGYPRKVIESVIEDLCIAYASSSIIIEYNKVIQRIVIDKKNQIDISLYDDYLAKIEIIPSEAKVEISRDIDDNKFIECAMDSNSLYVISGDQDLLVIKEYKGIQIITAKEFCEMYLLK